jgi:hypothetical protein
MRSAIASAAVVLALGAIVWAAFGDPTFLIVASGVAVTTVGLAVLRRRQRAR